MSKEMLRLHDYPIERRDGVRVGVAIEHAWPHLEMEGTDPDQSLP